MSTSGALPNKKHGLKVISIGLAWKKFTVAIRPLILRLILAVLSIISNRKYRNTKSTILNVSQFLLGKRNMLSLLSQKKHSTEAGKAEEVLVKKWGKQTRMSYWLTLLLKRRGSLNEQQQTLRPWLLERRRETGIDAAGLFRVAALLALLSLWKVTLTPLFSHVVFISDDSKNMILGRPTSTPANNVFGLSQSYSVSPSPTPDIYMIPTIQVLPTYTAYPTYTPLPTLAPQSNNMTLNVQYSYYWPPLLGPNCHPDNVLPSGGCKDTTASGEPWTKWRGKGVAIPIQWLDRIPFYSIVRVISPPEMIGDYTVVDLCGGCIKAEYPDLIWFDFLDDHLILNWSADLVVEIIPPQ